MSQVKSQVEVVRKGRLVVVHNVSVNYDQPVAEAILGLPYNNSLISSIPQAIWNGGKKGTVKTNIHLARADGALSTERGRQFLRGQNLNPCVSAEISALKPFCEELWNAGVFWAVALASSDQALWRHSRGNLRVVYLYFDPDDRGFFLGVADGDWNDDASFAGLPQVSS